MWGFLKRLQPRRAGDQHNGTKDYDGQSHLQTGVIISALALLTLATGMPYGVAASDGALSTTELIGEAALLSSAAATFAWSEFILQPNHRLAIPAGPYRAYTAETDVLSQVVLVAAILLPLSRTVIVESGGKRITFGGAIAEAARHSTTILLAASAKNVLKALISRPRPYASGPGGTPEGDPEALLGFPSGHSTIAWASAGESLYLAMKYPERRAFIALAIGEAILATSVSILRVASGEHNSGDVIAGAVIGASVGIIIQLVRFAPRHSDDREVS